MIALASIRASALHEGIDVQFEMTVEAVRHRVAARVVKTPFLNPAKKDRDAAGMTPGRAAARLFWCCLALYALTSSGNAFRVARRVREVYFQGVPPRAIAAAHALAFPADPRYYAGRPADLASAQFGPRRQADAALRPRASLF